ncbi:MAG: SixA phosphatase family protein [Beutenbergiaceae bacterium]
MPGVRLNLLRHAKAQQAGPSDHQREVVQIAREQCARVAHDLLTRDRVPELVLCSTAVRAQQTWELVAASLPAANPRLRLLDSLYLAGIPDVLDALAQVPPQITDVLVVGHEPTMSETGHYLAGPESDPAALAVVRTGLPTAALCLLDTESGWDHLVRGGATLLGVAS